MDGHVFSFFQRWSNGPLALYYHSYSSGSAWQSPGLVEPALNVWVPTWDQPTFNSDVSAREWVRFTVRIDPATSKADVWLNGKLRPVLGAKQIRHREVVPAHSSVSWPVCASRGQIKLMALCADYEVQFRPAAKAVETAALSATS